MVLLLKHWKSRSSPGIVAGACARDHKNPFTLLLASGAGSHIRGLGYRANMAQRPASLAERSEEHTSELQSLMRISYAVFCLKKKNIKTKITLVELTRFHNTQRYEPITNLINQSR